MEDVLRTGMTVERRTELVKRYASMTDAERILVHARHTDYSRANRDQVTGRGAVWPVFYYQTFLLAIAAPDSTRLRVQPKSTARISKRPKKKKRQISRAALWPWVHTMRADGFSWRDISGAMKKEHHIPISERYLAKLAAEVQAEQKLMEESK